MSRHVLPTLAAIEAAAARLAPYAVRTPLLWHPALDAVAGGRVWLKPEVLQRTGSFKFRGAYNKISQIDPKAFPGGVVATSSGNHAQGVAAASTLCGLRSAVVMPADAPVTKVARTKSFGAEVISYDRATEDRVAIAKRVCDERKAAFVHPFDDVDVIAGQGTCGLETAADLAAMGVTPDQMLVCCSGGGLATGIAIAMKARFPRVAVHSVEPEGFDDFARSLVAGRAVSNERRTGSVCDALMSSEPGEITFEIGRELLAPGLVISDREALDAVAFAFRELKLVVEPGGAAALAATLNRRVPTQGRVTVCILSGGNIDPDVLASALA